MSSYTFSLTDSRALSLTHTHIKFALSFGKLKRVGQKVPGFMLIFIKIILTCNVAAAATAHRAQSSGRSTAQAGDKFFSVLASFSFECMCMRVQILRDT